MRRICARLGELLATAFLCLAFTTLAYGQLGRGVVTGTVTDPSGAVIPGASVTLLNEATAVSRSVETNSAGIYRFDFTEVGSYTLRISAKGFANYELTKLVVTVAQTVTQDVQLELAKAAVQTIIVEAQGVQMVSTADAQISGLVSRTTIQNLPLEIRDATAFVNLMPGAVPNDFNASTRGAAVNGQRGGTGNFMIDGSDNNDYGQAGRSHNSAGAIPGGIVSISPDAVQEFRVVTNNYSAQYGRAGGFVADVVLKSGANTLHGSAFEYNRNVTTTANDFFSNAAEPRIKDHLVRNQFGGSLGGPLKKDKMFLFGAVEIQRMRQSFPQTTTSLRQEFVDWVDTGGLGAYYGLNCADPIEGMACTLGPIYRDLDSRFPLPRSTKPVSADDYYSTSPLFGGLEYPVPMFGQVTFPYVVNFRQNRWNLRYDHQISDKDTFNARYVFDDFDETDSTGYGDAWNPAFGGDGLGRSQSASIGYTHVFTPTVVNDYRMAYLRHGAPFTRWYPEIPSIFTIDTLMTGFGTASNLPQDFRENTFQFQDSLSVIKGRHTFRFGGEYRRTRNGSSFEADRDGIFYFWDTEDMLTDGALGDLFGLGGFYLAEASTDPSSPTPRRPEYYRGYRANELGGFIEDTWKITSRVTLTLGLRYDYFGVPHNFRAGLDSNFFFGSPNLNQCVLRQATGLRVCLPGQGLPDPVSTNPYYPVNPYTAAVFSGTFQQRNNEVWNKDTNNFAPRFGLAWDIRGNQKTVLRLGGGIFYDRLYNNIFENMRFNPPFFAFTQWGYYVGTVVGPISTPGFYSIPIDVANFAGGGGTPSARHMDQNMTTTYSEQYNVDLQHQFWGNWLLDVAYVGTLGHKLTGIVDVNTFPGRSGFGYSTRRINPNMGGDNMRANWYNSNYNSLQVRVSKRTSRGLTLDSGYTWSHALDYQSEVMFGGRFADIRPEDTWNRVLNYGAADFDLRHRFLTSFIYDLPVFKSNKILGGWSVNGVVTIQGGSPFTVWDSGNDVNGDGYYYNRAAYYGSGAPSSMIDHSKSPADGYLKNPELTGQTNPWTGSTLKTFDTTIADFNDPWSYGPIDGYMARNALYGPAFVNTDFSVSKKFKFTERTSMTLIISSFNALNHPNFNPPEGDVSSGDFGKSTSTVKLNNSGTGGRVMQWALRFDF